MPIRVAAVQFALGQPSYSEAVEAAVGLVRKAAERGASIVCFPEHWLLEYREHGYVALERLEAAARESGVAVVTGANYSPNSTPRAPELRVRSYVIGSDGRRLGHQDKVHLCQSEGKVAAPGDQFGVWQLSAARVGILNCYDCMFPEAARTLALKGADLLFVPSRIGSASLDPWILYLKVRALENRIPVVAPNVFRPPRYVGGSAIIDLRTDEEGRVVRPQIVASGGSGEKVLVADVDVERSRELRRVRFLDRRPAAYFTR